MRAFARVLGVLGAFVLSVAGIWGLGVSSASAVLGELDTTVALSGKLTITGTFTDLAPLPAPMEPIRLDVETRLYTVDATPTTIVVRREITQTVGILEPRSYPIQYAIDRQTYRQVPSRLAYAFAPAHVVDRSGTYGPVLPPDVTQRPYPVWDDAAGQPVELAPVGPPVQVDGLTLVTMAGQLDEVTASDHYVRALRDVMGIVDALPPESTFERLRPMFAQVDIDPIAVEGAVHGLLTETDRQLASEIIALPVPMRYVLDSSSSMRVELETGMQNSFTTTQVIAARPDTTQLARLYQLFTASHYDGDPGIALAAGLIGKLVDAPPRTDIATVEYVETDASVAASVAATKLALETMGPAPEVVPATLAAVGGAVLILGVGLGLREHRRGPAPESWRGMRARTIAAVRRCRRAADHAAGWFSGRRRAGQDGYRDQDGYRGTVVTVDPDQAPNPAGAATTRSAFAPRSRALGRPEPGQWSPVDVLASDDRAAASPSGRRPATARRRHRSARSVGLPEQQRSDGEKGTPKPPGADRDLTADHRRAVR